MLNSFEPEKERKDKCEEIRKRLRSMLLYLDYGKGSNIETLREYFCVGYTTKIALDVIGDSKLTAEADDVWKSALQRLLNCTDYTWEMLNEDVTKAGADAIKLFH